MKGRKKRRRVSVGRLGVWWTKLTGRQPQTCQVQTYGYPPPPPNTLFYFRATLTWSRPPRERVSHATCVCVVCVCTPPQPDLFSNLRVSISFDFLLTSITDQQHVESSWFGSWAHRFRRPLSLLVCHVRQQRDRIATTRHPRQYHLLIDAAIETEHTPTAHY
jgi:hypothetical protein